MAVLVGFSGEYDISSRDKLRRDLDRLASEADVVLDLTRVTFLDSTCLAELLRLHRLRAGNELKSLTVVLKPGGPIYRLLEVVNLTNVWRVVEE
jgi:anti-anti-sigma factor